MMHNFKKLASNT